MKLVMADAGPPAKRGLGRDSVSRVSDLAIAGDEPMRLGKSAGHQFCGQQPCRIDGARKGDLAGGDETEAETAVVGLVAHQQQARLRVGLEKLATGREGDPGFAEAMARAVQERKRFLGVCLIGVHPEPPASDKPPMVTGKSERSST